MNCCITTLTWVKGLNSSKSNPNVFIWHSAEQSEKAKTTQWNTKAIRTTKDNPQTELNKNGFWDGI